MAIGASRSSLRLLLFVFLHNVVPASIRLASAYKHMASQAALPAGLQAICQPYGILLARGGHRVGQLLVRPGERKGKRKQTPLLSNLSKEGSGDGSSGQPGWLRISGNRSRKHQFSANRLFRTVRMPQVRTPTPH